MAKGTMLLETRRKADRVQGLVVHLMGRHWWNYNLEILNGGHSLKGIRAYVAMARVDHWFKSVFCLPGIALAHSLLGRAPEISDLVAIPLGLLAVCLVSSSNYTINEWLDAATDREHPDKKSRPAASGAVKACFVYLQYVSLLGTALALGAVISRPFMWTILVLWIMGVLYNVPPVRTKDLPYLDTISEAVNNPIRLALGWWMIDDQHWLPVTVLAAYWMLGAYFMSLKRYAELRHIGAEVAGRYRNCLKYTNEKRLLIASVFYGNACCVLVGVFLAKYRVELLLAFPFIAAMLAVYLRVALRANSPVQHPEKLYTERHLMLVTVVTAVVIAGLLFVDLPAMRDFLEMQEPTDPLRIGLLSSGSGSPCP